ncbi:MAG: adenylosuccinate synthase [Anaerolineae bacterium]|jgi:adenylosuccinate synthase|nr:adenylosuccinate synthase [Anaerolineae bacterium]
MTVTAVVGAQWGDEGKGRIVDYLAQDVGMVIRFQGGDNAGHTVVNEHGTFRLHLVPSGIFNPNTACIIGPGTVIHPPALLDEMTELATAGISLDNLWISERAHVVMPYHRMLDGLEESARGGAQIGTTKRGIGPAYADKAARAGIRMGDLRRPGYLADRIGLALPRINRTIAHFGGEEVELYGLARQAMGWGNALDGRIVDTTPMVRAALTEGRDVLLEGQLGIMRDIDWGTYPYVTSSNPIAGGGFAGAGLPPRAIERVVGVVKAYCTAVGAGPFPTELHDDVAEHLRGVGQEYGATTGRPRRCGWLDGVALPYAAWLNGFTGLAITKLDVLDGLPELKICVGYRIGDEIVRSVPDTYNMGRADPVYESWPGWREETRHCRRWNDLPQAARAYLDRISEIAATPLQYISVGPGREQLIVL